MAVEIDFFSCYFMKQCVFVSVEWGCCLSKDHFSQDGLAEAAPTLSPVSSFRRQSSATIYRPRCPPAARDSCRRHWLALTRLRSMNAPASSLIFAMLLLLQIQTIAVEMQMRRKKKRAQLRFYMRLIFARSERSRRLPPVGERIGTCRQISPHDPVYPGRYYVASWPLLQHGA